MEHQQTVNLLNETSGSKFVTKNPGKSPVIN